MNRNGAVERSELLAMLKLTGRVEGSDGHVAGQDLVNRLQLPAQGTLSFEEWLQWVECEPRRQNKIKNGKVKKRTNYIYSLDGVKLSTVLSCRCHCVQKNYTALLASHHCLCESAGLRLTSVTLMEMGTLIEKMFPRLWNS